MTLNLILILGYGMTGAAVAWSASILLNNLLPLVQVWRLIGLHPFGPRSIAVASSSVVCIGGVGLIAGNVFGERRHGTTGHRAHRWSRVSGGALAIPHDAPLLGTSGEPSRQVGSIGTARHPLGQLPHADLRCRPGQKAPS